MCDCAHEREGDAAESPAAPNDAYGRHRELRSDGPGGSAADSRTPQLKRSAPMPCYGGAASDLNSLSSAPQLGHRCGRLHAGRRGEGDADRDEDQRHEKGTATMESVSEETRAYVEKDGQWVDATVISRAAETATLEMIDTRETVTLPADQLLLANTLPEEGVEDMTRLNYLHEPALLSNLSHRFSRDHMYTYTGKICIAVNPFNWQVSKPLYEEAVLLQYPRREMGDSPPHVYAIAEDAYQKIAGVSAQGGGNQSILVSGESGAGKTESVKIMMHYLATVSKSGDHNKVAQQVLATNPLLEAFGNARTSRNNNSSRFGKFIELQFDSAVKMAGARIHIYLLEKSRVVQQSAGERNYHVFYQLMCGLSDEEREQLSLSSPISEYRLLAQSGCIEILGVDDAAEFKRTRQAMESIGMSSLEQLETTRAISSVLLLAQLSFEQNSEEQASVASESTELLQKVATLLAIDQPDDLSAALTTRRLVTRDDVITVALNLEQSNDSRDALAKSLYGKLFSWLVERCNEMLVDDAAAAAFVGVLDIFGFEAFEVNSFEQLCINYANERLQQQFNWDVFKSEQAEYESEGIDWQYIEFVDNQETLNLIDRKEQMGILHLLDEECAIQKGSDEKFVHKVRERHSGHSHFDVPKRDQMSFTIWHYAGRVTYSVGGFREKNKDTLHQDLSAVMQESQSAFVRQLFPADATLVSPLKGLPRKGKAKSADKMTVGSQFMTQLASLMRTINSTGVHYVRCIKPNTANAPKIFDMKHTAHQLRCAGVLEAVRISRMAYPNRMPHAAFVQRYVLLAEPQWRQAKADAIVNSRTASPGDTDVRSTCEQALLQVVQEPQRYQLGRTKVFFKAFLLEALEQRRGAALSLYAVLLQKNVLALLYRRFFLRKRGAAIKLEVTLRLHMARVSYRRQKASAIRLQARLRGERARRHAVRLRAAVRIQAMARASASRDRTMRLRRHARASCIQAAARRRAKRVQFERMRQAALRLQSHWRMVSQRWQYLRDLAEKKEEAKLSTQLARLQAQLQAEIDARQRAEDEQARMRAERDAVGPVEVTGLAAGASAVRIAAGDAVPPAIAVDALSDAGSEPSQAGSIRSTLAGAAAKYFGYAPSSSMEDASEMLQRVTKDRERLTQKLAAETEARKRLEAEKRELEKNYKVGSAKSQMEHRRARDVSDALNRKKEEVAEMRQMMQHQTIEIANLQNSKLTLERRLLELEKKISQFDDSFYTLEARNVRDRTKMEEMGKAKSRAEEEKNVYRLMLEQAHERWLKERQDLRRDCQDKIEDYLTRNEEQRQRMALLERELQRLSQVEEEAKMYKTQCSILNERMAQLASGTVHVPSPARTPSSSQRSSNPIASALSPSPGGMGLLDNLKARLNRPHDS